MGLFTKEFGPVDVNCFEVPLWESPKYLQCVTELNNELIPGETYELSYRVIDLLGYNVPFCPVYLEGDGTFDSYINLTGTDGLMKVNWTVPSDGSSASFNASIFLANGSTLSVVEESYALKQGNSNTIPMVETNAANSITENSAKLNGEVTSDEGAGIIERGFYWSVNNTLPHICEFTVQMKCMLRC